MSLLNNNVKALKQVSGMSAAELRENLARGKRSTVSLLLPCGTPTLNDARKNCW